MFLMAVIVYGLSALCCALVWRKGFREDSLANYLLVLAGFLFHTTAMFMRGFSLSKCPIYNLHEATVFATWALLAAYLMLGLWPRWRFLLAFTSPILFAAGVFALMPNLDPPHTSSLVLTGVGPSLHATLSLLSYGAFALSAVSAMMFLMQERDLKQHKLRALLSLLPPLERLDRVVSRSLVAGFVLLTLGLLTGFAGLKHLTEKWSLDDANILWSVLVWFLYGSLLLLRWRFAHRGRRLAFGSIGCFTFVFLTFWGTNLLSSIHNPAVPLKDSTKPSAQTARRADDRLPAPFRPVLDIPRRAETRSPA